MSSPADRDGMELSAIALQGLQQANTQLERAATRIAGAGASPVEGMPVDFVDLSVQVVAMVSAQEQFEANLATLRTAGEMYKSSISLFA